MDHRTPTMAVVVRKMRRRPRRQGARLQWGVVRRMLHMRIKDAAAELDVPVSYLRDLCHQNGYTTWPGKMIRSMNSTGLIPLGVDVPEGSPWAWLASRSRLAKVGETKKKKDAKDITGIHEPVANHAPRKALVTLNLIDKVGSSSSSRSN